MFTGIIIEIGRIVNVNKSGNALRIAVSGSLSSKKLIEGSSIAVNGICLTVTNIRGDIFEADVMPETVKRTTLSRVKAGEAVNLEPALRLGDEMGGHFVTGHVDITGMISEIIRDENSIWLKVNTIKDFLAQIVQKGSIALDGVSLTVAKADSESFMVSLIPFTANQTTLGDKKVGDFVNIETDVIGKYIEKQLNTRNTAKKSEVTLSLLKEHGFV